MKMLTTVQRRLMMHQSVASSPSSLNLLHGLNYLKWTIAIIVILLTTVSSDGDLKVAIPVIRITPGNFGKDSTNNSNSMPLGNGTTEVVLPIAIPVTLPFLKRVAFPPCPPLVAQSFKDSLGIAKFWNLWNTTHALDTGLTTTSGNQSKITDNNSPCTIFAIKDNGFAKYPQLYPHLQENPLAAREFLSNHIVIGPVPLANLNKPLTTSGGLSLQPTHKGDGTYINGIKIEKDNIELTSGGNVYVVTGPLCCTSVVQLSHPLIDALLNANVPNNNNNNPTVDETWDRPSISYLRKGHLFPNNYTIQARRLSLGHSDDENNRTAAGINRYVYRSPADVIPIGGPTSSRYGPNNDSVLHVMPGLSGTSFLTLLQLADCRVPLSRKDPVTIFLPSDEAISNLPPRDLKSLISNPERLKQALLYHIAPGTFTSDVFSGNKSITTVEGQPLHTDSISNGTLKTVEGAKVILSDIIGHNGVIHVIDRFLYPIPNGTLMDTLEKLPNLKLFLDLLKRVNLTDLLRVEEPYTVFAPTDEALKNISTSIPSTPEGNDKLKVILLNHLVPGIAYTASWSPAQILPTAGGHVVYLQYEPNESGGFNLLPNGATVSKSDIGATNGVIHIIKDVMPIDYFPTPQPPRRTFWQNIWDTVLGLVGRAKPATPTPSTEPPQSTESKPSEDDLVATLKKLPNAKYLLDALNVTGLITKLEKGGPYTIFVPVNSAFEHLGKPFLDFVNQNRTLAEKILLNHIVPNELLCDELKTINSANTLEGKQLIISPSDAGCAKVDNTEIIYWNITAKDGVIHLIDKIIFLDELPEELLPSSSEVPFYSTSEEAQEEYTTPVTTEEGLSSSSTTRESVPLATSTVETVTTEQPTTTEVHVPTVISTVEGVTEISTIISSEGSVSTVIPTEESFPTVTTEVSISTTSEEEVGTSSSRPTQQLEPEGYGFFPEDTEEPNVTTTILPSGRGVGDLYPTSETPVLYLPDNISDMIVPRPSVNFTTITPKTPITLTDLLKQLNATLFPSLLNKTALDKALSIPDPLTIFVPTDDAFKNVDNTTLHKIMSDPEQLRRVLLYHVIPTRIPGEDLPRALQAGTLAGVPVFITVYVIKEKPTPLVNNATILPIQHESDNTIVFLIDKVLTSPPEGDIFTTISKFLKEDTTKDHIIKSRLDPVLTGPGPLTMFVPTQRAWNSLPQNVKDQLTTNITALKEYIFGHIVVGAIFTPVMTQGSQFKTLNGKTLTVTHVNGGIRINNGLIIQPDIVATNGVIHIIDNVFSIEELPTDVTITSVTESEPSTAATPPIEKTIYTAVPVTSEDVTTEQSTETTTTETEVPTMTTETRITVEGESKEIEISTTEAEIGITETALTTEAIKTTETETEATETAITTTVAETTKTEISTTETKTEATETVISTTEVEATTKLSTEKSPENVTSVPTVIEVTTEQIQPLLIVLRKNGLTKLAEYLDTIYAPKILNLYGLFTLFAPTNEAFTSLPPDELKQLEIDPQSLQQMLLYHAISRILPYKDITDGLVIPSIQGRNLTFNVYDNGRVKTVLGKEILRPDIQVMNGFVHVIDKILYPIPQTTTLQTLDEKFPSFSSAINDSVTRHHYKDKGVTAFIPTEEFWARMPHDLREKVFSNVSLLNDIATNHVCDGQIFKIGIRNGANCTTLSGNTLKFTIVGDNYYVNSVPIIRFDLINTDGIIHVIQSPLFLDILLPEGDIIGLLPPRPTRPEPPTSTISTEYTEPAVTWKVFDETELTTLHEVASISTEATESTEGYTESSTYRVTTESEETTPELLQTMTTTATSSTEIPETSTSAEEYTTHTADITNATGKSISIDEEVTTADISTTHVEAENVTESTTTEIPTYTTEVIYTETPMERATEVTETETPTERATEVTGTETQTEHATEVTGTETPTERATEVIGTATPTVYVTEVTTATVTTTEYTVTPLYTPVPNDTIPSILKQQFEDAGYDVDVNQLNALLPVLDRYTAFFPNSVYLQGLPTHILQDLITNQTAFRDVFVNHICPGAIYSQTFTNGMSCTTIGGKPLVVNVIDGNYYANNVPIIQVDIPAMDGVVHLINGIIFVDYIRPTTIPSSSEHPTFNETTKETVEETTEATLAPRIPVTTNISTEYAPSTESAEYTTADGTTSIAEVLSTAASEATTTVEIATGAEHTTLETTTYPATTRESAETVVVTTVTETSVAPELSTAEVTTTYYGEIENITSTTESHTAATITTTYNETTEKTTEITQYAEETTEATITSRVSEASTLSIDQPNATEEYSTTESATVEIVTTEATEEPTEHSITTATSELTTETITLAPNETILSTFKKQFKDAGYNIIVTDLEHNIPPPHLYTAFLPYSVYLQGLPSKVIEDLVKNNTAVRDMFISHVCTGATYSPQFSGGFTCNAVSGKPIHVTYQNGNYLCNDIPIVRVDIPALDGVTHLINGFLIFEPQITSSTPKEYTTAVYNMTTVQPTETTQEATVTPITVKGREFPIEEPLVTTGIYVTSTTEGIESTTKAAPKYDTTTETEGGVTIVVNVTMPVEAQVTEEHITTTIVAINQTEAMSTVEGTTESVTSTTYYEVSTSKSTTTHYTVAENATRPSTIEYIAVEETEAPEPKSTTIVETPETATTTDIETATPEIYTTEASTEKQATSSEHTVAIDVTTELENITEVIIETTRPDITTEVPAYTTTTEFTSSSEAPGYRTSEEPKPSTTYEKSTTTAYEEIGNETSSTTHEHVTTAVSTSTMAYSTSFPYETILTAIKQLFEAVGYTIDITYLIETLPDTQQYTAFLPNSLYLQGLPSDTLHDLVTNKTAVRDVFVNNICPEETYSSRFHNGFTCTSVGGRPLVVTIINGNYYINDFPIVKVDIPAADGVIHLLNGILYFEPLSVTPASTEKTTVSTTQNYTETTEHTTLRYEAYTTIAASTEQEVSESTEYSTKYNSTYSETPENVTISESYTTVSGTSILPSDHTTQPAETERTESTTTTIVPEVYTTVESSVAYTEETSTGEAVEITTIPSRDNATQYTEASTTAEYTTVVSTSEQSEISSEIPREPKEYETVIPTDYTSTYRETPENVTISESYTTVSGTSILPSDYTIQPAETESTESTITMIVPENYTTIASTEETSTPEAEEKTVLPSQENVTQYTKASTAVEYTTVESTTEQPEVTSEISREPKEYETPRPTTNVSETTETIPIDTTETTLASSTPESYATESIRTTTAPVEYTTAEVSTPSPNETIPSIIQQEFEEAGYDIDVRNLIPKLPPTQLYTLFLPYFIYLRGLPSNLIKDFVNNETLVTETFVDHICPGAIYSSTFKNGFTCISVGGNPIVITTSDGRYYSNGFPIIRVDIPTVDGVIHLLDGLLSHEYDGITPHTTVVTSESSTVREQATVSTENYTTAEVITTTVAEETTVAPEGFTYRAETITLPSSTGESTTESKYTTEGTTSEVSTVQPAVPSEEYTTPAAEEQSTTSTMIYEATTKLVTSTETTELVTGTEITELVTGAKTTESVTGAKTTESVTGTETTEWVTGTETTESVTGTETTESVTGTETTESVTGTETTESVTGVETTESVTGVETTESVTGAETTESVTGAETTESVTGAETTESVTGAETTESVTGVKTTESVTGAETTESVTGAETTESVTGVETTESVTGVETTESVTGAETTELVTGAETTELVIRAGTTQTPLEHTTVEIDRLSSNDTIPSVLKQQFKRIGHEIDATDFEPHLPSGQVFTACLPYSNYLLRIPHTIINELVNNKTFVEDLFVNHVCTGALYSAQFGPGNSCVSLGGKQINIRKYNGKYYCNNFPIVQSDIPTVDGVVHLINGLLFLEDAGVTPVPEITNATTGYTPEGTTELPTNVTIYAATELTEIAETTEFETVVTTTRESVTRPSKVLNITETAENYTQTSEVTEATTGYEPITGLVTVITTDNITETTSEEELETTTETNVTETTAYQTITPKAVITEEEIVTTIIYSAGSENVTTLSYTTEVPERATTTEVNVTEETTTKTKLLFEDFTTTVEEAATTEVYATTEATTVTKRPEEYTTVGTQPPTPNMTIPDIIEIEFSKAGHDIDVSDVSSRLPDRYLYTAFIPHFTFINKFPASTLYDIIKNKTAVGDIIADHVCPEATYSSQFVNGFQCTSIEGKPIIITQRNGIYHVNGIPIIQVDIPALDGVVHLINGFLFFEPRVTTTPLQEQATTTTETTTEPSEVADVTKEPVTPRARAFPTEEPAATTLLPGVTVTTTEELPSTTPEVTEYETTTELAGVTIITNVTMPVEAQVTEQVTTQYKEATMESTEYSTSKEEANQTEISTTVTPRIPLVPETYTTEAATAYSVTTGNATEVGDVTTEETVTYPEIPMETTEISELPETTKISKLPETTEISKLPETTEISKLPKTTEISKLPKTTEISELPEGTEISELPEGTEISELPKTTEISELSETTEISKLPETTEISKLPEITEISKLPKPTEISELPEGTEISELPETTEISKLPETTEISKLPETTEGTTITAITTTKYVAEATTLPQNETILSAFKTQFENIGYDINITELSREVPDTQLYTAFLPYSLYLQSLPSQFLRNVVNNNSAVRDVFINHVCPDATYSPQLTDGFTCNALSGKPIYVTHENGQLYCNGFLIIQVDIPALDGVIHLINGLLNIEPEIVSSTITQHPEAAESTTLSSETPGARAFPTEKATNATTIFEETTISTTEETVLVNVTMAVEAQVKENATTPYEEQTTTATEAYTTASEETQQTTEFKAATETPTYTTIYPVNATIRIRTEYPVVENATEVSTIKYISSAETEESTTTSEIYSTPQSEISTEKITTSYEVSEVTTRVTAENITEMIDHTDVETTTESLNGTTAEYGTTFRTPITAVTYTIPSTNETIPSVIEQQFKDAGLDIDVTDLNKTLTTTHSYTAFIPYSVYLQGLPTDVIQELVTNKTAVRDVFVDHICIEATFSREFGNGFTCRTVGGRPLTVSIVNGKYYLNNYPIVQVDILAADGVIHLLSGILHYDKYGVTPPPIEQTTVHVTTEQLDLTTTASTTESTTTKTTEIVEYTSSAEDVTEVTYSTTPIEEITASPTSYLNVTETVDTTTSHPQLPVNISTTTTTEEVETTTTLEAEIKTAVYKETTEVETSTAGYEETSLEVTTEAAITDHTIEEETSTTPFYSTTKYPDVFNITIEEISTYRNVTEETSLSTLLPTSTSYPEVTEATTIPFYPTSEGGRGLLSVSIFFYLIDLADVDQILAHGGPYTILAPVDSAFSGLPPQVMRKLEDDPTFLKDVILYHILPNKIESTDLENDNLLKTLQGQDVRCNIYGPVITIGGAKIILPDSDSGYGVLHIVNKVLYPLPNGTALDTLQPRNDTDKVQNLIRNTTLPRRLQEPGAYTVFIPSDRALNTLPSSIIDALEKNSSLLEEFVLNHMVNGTYYTEGMAEGLELTSMGGQLLRISMAGGLTVNGVPIVNPDISVTNGVVHIIDRILYNPFESITIPKVEPVVHNDLNVVQLSKLLNLTTFTNLLSTSGLSVNLSEPGPFTVFAPTNEAFDEMPPSQLEEIQSNPEKLKQLLLYHVIPLKLHTTEVTNEMLVPSLVPAKNVRMNIYVNNRGPWYTASGSQILQPNNVASNGIVHVVHQVLYIPLGDIVQTVERCSILQTLRHVITVSGLTEDIRVGNYTLLAPNDAAFNKLPEDVLQRLLVDPNIAKAFLLGHLLRGTVNTEGIFDESTMTTVANNDIYIRALKDCILLNSAAIQYPDVTADNGVVHVIDRVLQVNY